MTRPSSFLLLVLLTAAVAYGACVPTALEPVPVDPNAKPVAFVEDVKPVLDQRCVVCHSCYNAPCQLKLSSFEGAARGGTKVPVYDSTRLVAVDPTRLFIDAHSTPAWRKKGFHSVLESSVSGDFNDSVLLQMLEAKRRDPVPQGEYVSENVALSCSADSSELGIFLALHPDRGMPFGLPLLSDAEHQTLATWVSGGAAGPTPEQQHELTTPSAGAAAEIAKWESFLNQLDPKHVMTARYLYEHYFLAHLRFSAVDGREFFELVRSSTPPGKPIDILATRRPYDAVDADPIYYRFRKIHSTIVHKTHMVVELDDARLARIRELFIEPKWLDEPHVTKLGDKSGANPFIVYAQIPPRSRYQFLLDHSEYIIDSFTRGPVCKGQIAVNVIHDHFWLLFLDPDSDETVRNPTFLVEQADNLSLPNEAGSQQKVLKTFSDEYRDRYKRFYRAKMDLYSELDPLGFGIDDIWTGESAADAPMLTIYRHFDSASVQRGALGDLTRTAWVIDYPQFERIYYALVAGFDVFGNISHQVNVRRYMDYLRIEGELNFLQFMPVEQRLPMLESWYLGDKAIDNVSPSDVSSTRPSRVVFRTKEPKRELFEQVIGDRLPLDQGIRFDPINYSWDGKETPMPTSFTTPEDVLDGFRALTAPGTGFIRNVTESNVNVILVRVVDYAGADRFFTIVINRWHDNVNSMFREADTLDPKKDTIDFLPGNIGSYPNYFMVVPAADVPDFFDLLENFDGSSVYIAKLRKYGIDRGDPYFWETYDWFQKTFDEEQPIEAGLYDLNRYYSTAGELEIPGE
jgi:hypothetical protein